MCGDPRVPAFRALFSSFRGARHAGRVASRPAVGAGSSVFCTRPCGAGNIDTCLSLLFFRWVMGQRSFPKKDRRVLRPVCCRIFRCVLQEKTPRAKKLDGGRFLLVVHLSTTHWLFLFLAGWRPPTLDHLAVAASSLKFESKHLVVYGTIFVFFVSVGVCLSVCLEKCSGCVLL